MLQICGGGGGGGGGAPTLPSLLVQGLVSLTLQRHQHEVHALPVQQLAVLPPLHRPAVLEAHDHVSVLDGGETVSDGDGGAAQANLQVDTSVLEI